ncbi:MAG: response regulator [bacterium]
MKILIVDDEKDAEALFRQKFRKEIKAGEIDLLFAVSAEAALKELRPESGRDVALVLADINMPGMSGLELLQEIRKRKLAVQVYLITGLGDQETQKVALASDGDAFFTKPLDFEALKNKMLGI